jgi:Winged helix DNA-binding domain
MADAGIGLRRLASQRIVASRRLAEPGDVVRWLGALQAQDSVQSLWAIGSRLRAGRCADVERAVEQGRLLRTWLMRGTIHFAPPEDVRWLLALTAPRLAAAEARRCEQLGLTSAHLDRSGELLAGELSGGRRRTRSEVMRLLEANGIETSGQRGYHILVHLAKRGLICLGPMQERRQTFVLLDDWAPRTAARELAGEEALALLAERFAISRGPVTDRDFARWAGIALADARRGLAAAEGVTRRRFGAVEHWLSADDGDRIPAAGRTQAYLLAGFDEYLLGYKDRDAVLDPAHSGKIAPGANGIFKPMVVVGGQIAGTWGRVVRGGELTLSLHPFAAASSLAGQVAREAARYRDFLGLPGDAQPVVRVERPAA